MCKWERIGIDYETSGWKNCTTELTEPEWSVIADGDAKYCPYCGNEIEMVQ